jgi:hypothetical protein
MLFIVASLPRTRGPDRSQITANVGTLGKVVLLSHIRRSSGQSAWAPSHPHAAQPA